ncbi:MAG: RidA family protein [Candidatus Riflebacteria bacterium]|nr:RidA family protein [Candidatus Riflebacteria bacterium]
MKKGFVQFLNPEKLIKNTAFSQVAVISGSTKTVYIGGQNSVDSSGNIIAKGDIKGQAEQILANLQIALEAGGAKFENLIKWNVYVVQGQSPREGFEVFQKVLGGLVNPPLITMNFVAGLANPEFLMEIDAIAVVPEEK